MTESEKPVVAVVAADAGAPELGRMTERWIVGAADRETAPGAPGRVDGADPPAEPVGADEVDADGAGDVAWSAADDALEPGSVVAALGAVGAVGALDADGEPGDAAEAGVAAGAPGDAAAADGAAGGAAGGAAEDGAAGGAADDGAGDRPVVPAAVPGGRLDEGRGEDAAAGGGALDACTGADVGLGVRVAGVAGRVEAGAVLAGAVLAGAVPVTRRRIAVSFCRSFWVSIGPEALTSAWRRTRASTEVRFASMPPGV